jgi:DNA-binding transcriptional LysR family regulator
MPVDIKHLKYVEAAERHGSFRKAAESLAIKQSNLSRRIKDLEEQLDVTLFERTSGGVHPTLAGLDFVRGARRVLGELQNVAESAKAAGRGETGRLAVGFYTSLSAGHLRATLLDYARRFPEVEINAVEGTRRQLCDSLESGAIDIAILTGDPVINGCQSMVLWSERIIIVLPETHPLASKQTIYWTDLKREQFVLTVRNPGPEIQDILIAKLYSPGDPPAIAKHDVGPDNIRSLVSASQSVSVMCESCVGISCAGVVYREVHDAHGITSIGYSASWREGNGNPPLGRFISLLEERCPPVANGLHGEALQMLDPSP